MEKKMSRELGYRLVVERPKGGLTLEINPRSDSRLKTHRPAGRVTGSLNYI